MMSRREALGILGAVALSQIHPVGKTRQKRSIQLLGQRNPRPPFGAALEYEPLQREPDYRKWFPTIVKCAAISGPLFWRFSEPERNRFVFEHANAMVEFARRNGLPVHGHTLVWHDELPSWTSTISDQDDARAAIERHVTTLVSHYAGAIQYWDVVNEPVEPTWSGELRETIWLKWLGERYIDSAFRAARAADPIASLGLNEFGVENDSGFAEKKRRALVALVRRMLDANVPIGHVGIQAHLSPSDRFSRSGLGRFLQTLRSLGVRIAVTELDVDDRDVLGSDSHRDRVVADTYARFLDIAMANVQLEHVITWGLTDRHTWYAWKSPRADRRRPRPLPFDEHLQPKLAWKVLNDRLSVARSN